MAHENGVVACRLADADDKSYAYESLPQGSNRLGPLPFTRLLDLSPGHDSEPLCCKLIVTNVREKAGTYEALSYIRRPSETTVSMSCNSKEIEITANLQDALLRLRCPDRRRLLWVDGICINQEDTAERGQQVQMMRYIYRYASRTIVWLGTGEELELDFETAQNLTGKSGHSYSNSWPQEQQARPEFSEKDLLSLSRIMSNPWFYRVWSVQEVSLSAKAVAFAGKCKMDLFQLIRSARLLLRSSHPLQDEERLRFWASMSARRKVERRVEGCLGSILSLMQELRNFQALDPRDKVYAILGITSEGISPSSAHSEECSDSNDLIQCATILEQAGPEAPAPQEAPLFKDPFNPAADPFQPTPRQQHNGLSPKFGQFQKQRLPSLYDLMKDNGRQYLENGFKKATEEYNIDEFPLPMFNRRDSLNILAHLAQDPEQVTQTPQRHQALVPDYDKSCQEVYTDLALFILQHKPGYLDVLSHVQHASRPVASAVNGERWPSWVPHWNQAGGTCLLEAGQYQPYLNRRADVKVHDSITKSITLRGIQLDTVIIVGQPIQIGQNLLEDIMRIWLQLHLSGFTSTSPMSPLLDLARIESILRTLACLPYTPRVRDDMSAATQETQTGHSSGIRRQKISAAELAAIASMLHAKLEQTSNHDEVLEDITMQRYNSLIRHRSSGRRIFITQQGRLGLGPAVMQPGDAVHLFFGGRVPLVLGSAPGHETENRLLIGEAFLDDESVMHGKENINEYRVESIELI